MLCHRHRRLGTSGQRRYTSGMGEMLRAMTLREYLADAKYQTWYWLLSVSYVIAVAGAIYLFAPIGGILVPMVGLLGLMLMFLFGPYLFRLIRCPRCSARLGALGYWAVTTAALGSRFQQPVRDIANRQIERLGKCPNCGLRLDEPIGVDTHHATPGGAQ